MKIWDYNEYSDLKQLVHVQTVNEGIIDDESKVEFRREMYKTPEANEKKLNSRERMLVQKFDFDENDNYVKVSIETKKYIDQDEILEKPNVMVTNGPFTDKAAEYLLDKYVEKNTNVSTFEHAYRLTNLYHNYLLAIFADVLRKRNKMPCKIKDIEAIYLICSEYNNHIITVAVTPIKNLNNKWSLEVFWIYVTKSYEELVDSLKKDILDKGEWYGDIFCNYSSTLYNLLRKTFTKSLVFYDVQQIPILLGYLINKQKNSGIKNYLDTLYLRFRNLSKTYLKALISGENKTRLAEKILRDNLKKLLSDLRVLKMDKRFVDDPSVEFDLMLNIITEIVDKDLQNAVQSYEYLSRCNCTESVPFIVYKAINLTVSKKIKAPYRLWFMIICDGRIMNNAVKEGKKYYSPNLMSPLVRNICMISQLDKYFYMPHYRGWISANKLRTARKCSPRLAVTMPSVGGLLEGLARIDEDVIPYLDIYKNCFINNKKDMTYESRILTKDEIQVYENNYKNLMLGEVICVNAKREHLCVRDYAETTGFGERTVIDCRYVNRTGRINDNSHNERDWLKLSDLKIGDVLRIKIFSEDIFELGKNRVRAQYIIRERK